jgi:hypothetical protein
MKKLLLTIIIFFSCAGFIHSQTQAWQWARASKGTANRYDYGRTICSDKKGNVYVAGVFESTSFTLGSVTLSDNLNMLT